MERLLLSRHMEDNGLALAASKTLSHAIQAAGTAFSFLSPIVSTIPHSPVLFSRAASLPSCAAVITVVVIAGGELNAEHRKSIFVV